MIVIISKRQLESTTEKVMEWLYFYGRRAVRINGDDIMEDDLFYLNVPVIKPFLRLKENKSINLEEVSVVWFRRWSDLGYINKYTNPEKSNTEIPYWILQNVTADQTVLRNFLFSQFDNKPFISDPRKFGLINKFIVLSHAKEVGFRIPETIVCNSKEKLLPFLKQKKRIITKDIENSYMVKLGSCFYTNFTSEISESMENEIPEKFAMSAFQELIEKKYELRIFYFFREIYSMAIFSQNDNQTAIDFRQYNHIKPNRNVPYHLPDDVKAKIERLMQALGLETGSIDIIRTTDGDYMFLEVNPVGQISMVSVPCNYKLESLIAKKLISYESSKKI